MTRYVAFLRGVSPLNAKMPTLKRAFEAAGFDDVRTVLGSGNVVFGVASAATKTLERKCEAAMQQQLGRTFGTIVRSAAVLQRLIDRDPFAPLHPPAGAKRIVTFLRTAPATKPKLPIERDGTCIGAFDGGEVFSYYVPSAKGPVFMALIEKTFGRDVTTRTWETVAKCVAAAERD